MVTLEKIHVQEYRTLTLNHTEVIFKFKNGHFEAIRIEPLDSPDKIANLLHALAENIRENVTDNIKEGK